MRNAWLMLRKDLRVLRRSPLLLGVLVAYPLLIAVLVVLVAGYANAKPRVALVDLDGLPEVVVIGGQRFHVNRTIERVSREVELVYLSQAEAERQLETGDVVAVVTVPEGFVAELQRMVESPTLILETTTGGIAPRTTQQMQALVYELNRTLQERYIAANLRYVELILRGGEGRFLGRDFEILGLQGTQDLLADLPSGPRLDQIREFVRVAQLALDQTDDALIATANPIELKMAPERGRQWALSAQVQAHALALTVTFLTLMLAAGALAAERDENVIGRLARGLVGFGQLLAAKVAVAALIAVGLGLAIALSFGIAIELGDVIGGQPWVRMPILAGALALAGVAVGTLGALVGALAREARTASLVALLVVLPIVFLGLVPREVVPPAGWVSDAFPFGHSIRLFAAALYDADPWRRIAIETAWLVGLAAAFGTMARLGMRRLLA